MIALANDLQAGFEVMWYRIESVLGRGGFGITYLATDTNLNQSVAIKEYLPHDFAARSGNSTVQPVSQDQEDVYSWGLDRFMSEAQTLAKFKHNNIVRVLSVFQLNNTGYIVMEYEHGRPLDDIYEQKKIFTQEELESIYFPILNGLSAVHQTGFIHRDIKPANIYIRDQDSSPVLLDFGAARQAVGGKTRTLTSMLSVGYAPFEQYNEGTGKQGPWTDIYALGACLHQGITGDKPSESTLRAMTLLHNEPDSYQPLSLNAMDGYSYAFLRGIDQSLMLHIHDRPQTLEDFYHMLRGSISLPPLPPPENKNKSARYAKTVIRPAKRGKDADTPADKSNNPGVAARSRGSAESLEHNSKNARPTEPSSGLFTARLKLLVGIIAILAIAITSFIFFYPREMSPKQIRQQQIEAHLEKAGQYYDNGDYIGEGSNNALTQYQEALALDNKNKAAQNGVKKIANQFYTSAETSMENENYSQAGDSLKTLASISPTFPSLKALQKELAKRVKSEQELNRLEDLLNSALSAQENNHLYTPEPKSAYSYYKQVVAIDPGNITAEHGLSEIADVILLDAREYLGDKKYAKAEELVAMAEPFDPDSSVLADIKQQLSTRGELAKLITLADKAYSQRRYTSPSSNNALKIYNQVLSIDPKNSHAKVRIREMADFYAEKAKAQIRSGKLANAQNSINLLSTHFPKHTGISKLKTSLAQKQQQKAIAKTDTLQGIKHLIPANINQQQDETQVVQDIVGRFILFFNNQDIKGLKSISQLSAQQESLYSSLFNLYKSLKLKVIPGSFSINKKQGMAIVRFQISDLIGKDGSRVQTSANWSMLALNINNKKGYWLKAVVISG